MPNISGAWPSARFWCAPSPGGGKGKRQIRSLEPVAPPRRPRLRRNTMLEWLIIAAVVILAAIFLLAYLDLADTLVDLASALAQLAVAVVTMTITLLALLINALRGS